MVVCCREQHKGYRSSPSMCDQEWMDDVQQCLCCSTSPLDTIKGAIYYSSPLVLEWEVLVTARGMIFHVSSLFGVTCMQQVP
uniref:Uncharacterized protein n=1 Tax=Rhizophora mucronata TaxID=61149 RepID=A0A2P2N0E2_RHIMU